MTNIVELRPGIVGDNAKIEPDMVLKAGLGKLLVAVVVGVENDGSLYLASSDGRPEVIALFERAKAKLIADWES